MSYRAFKRLLGETSLERKCRFLFGGFILLLLTASFWLYARQTEYLAYEQIPTMSRLLFSQIVERQIATTCRQPEQPLDVQRSRSLDEFRDRSVQNWPQQLQKAEFKVFKP